MNSVYSVNHLVTYLALAAVAVIFCVYFSALAMYEASGDTALAAFREYAYSQHRHHLAMFLAGMAGLFVLGFLGAALECAWKMRPPGWSGAGLRRRALRSLLAALNGAALLALLRELFLAPGPSGYTQLPWNAS